MDKNKTINQVYKCKHRTTQTKWTLTQTQIYRKKERKKEKGRERQK
jgi:hypothetical protein